MSRDRYQITRCKTGILLTDTGTFGAPALFIPYDGLGELADEMQAAWLEHWSRDLPVEVGDEVELTHTENSP